MDTTRVKNNHERISPSHSVGVQVYAHSHTHASCPSPSQSLWVVDVAIGDVVVECCDGSKSKRSESHHISKSHQHITSAQNSPVLRFANHSPLCLLACLLAHNLFMRFEIKYCVSFCSIPIHLQVENVPLSHLDASLVGRVQSI